MKITECRDILAATIGQTTCSAREDTLMARTGRSVLRMAAAYESDGRTFLSRDDPVNALAAFMYGLGWIHCGTASGILSVSAGRPVCPFLTPSEKVPASHYLKLDEKTGRYARLLTTAAASVSPAPAPGTPAYAFALQVLFIAEMYLQQGNREASRSRKEDGLACFSYGHGWLDAGVEIGLFSITGHHEIFTAG